VFYLFLLAFYSKGLRPIFIKIKKSLAALQQLRDGANESGKTGVPGHAR
jgi:hypothetical protein